MKDQRQLLQERILLAATLIDCQNECLMNEAFTCRSFTYESESKTCSLSHHTTKSQALTRSLSHVYYEVSACFEGKGCESVRKPHTSVICVCKSITRNFANDPSFRKLSLIPLTCYPWTIFFEIPSLGFLSFLCFPISCLTTLVCSVMISIMEKMIFSFEVFILHEAVSLTCFVPFLKRSCFLPIKMHFVLWWSHLDWTKEKWKTKANNTYTSFHPISFLFPQYETQYFGITICFEIWGSIIQTYKIPGYYYKQNYPLILGLKATTGLRYKPYLISILSLSSLLIHSAWD